MRLFDEGNLVNYDSLGIYQLRDIGRKVGVKLPTTLKKAELIKQIKAISSGEQQPYVQLDKKGRPPKNISGMKEFIDIYLPTVKQDSAIDLFGTNFDYGFTGVCASDYEKSEYITASKKEQVIKGYFDAFNGGGVIASAIDKDVYVFCTKESISKYDLRKGDFVECLAEYIGQNKPLNLCNILKVNGKEIKFIRFDFKGANNQKKQHHIPIRLGQDENSYDNQLIDCRYGDRIIVSGDNRRLVDYGCLNLVEAISVDKSALVITVIIDGTNEEITEFTKINGNVVFASKFGDSFEKHAKSIDIAHEYALRLCESGANNVVVVLPNLDNAIKAFCNEKYTLYEVVRRFKQLFMCAKCTTNSSLTFVYGAVTTGAVYNNFNGSENAKLRMQKNAISSNLRLKYDIIASYRNDIEFNESELRVQVYDYLNRKGNSNNAIQVIDSLLFECNTASEFLSELALQK